MQVDRLLNLDQIQQERAIRAQESFKTFVRQAWHVVEPATPFIDGWHIDALCEHLEAVTRGDIPLLLINMPPRHMKSLLVSVMWPMWEWTTKPHTRWMFSSYALSLAIRDSLKCRRLIESDWYQRNWGHVFTMAKDQNLKSRFENDKRGYRLAVSVGSAATGEGGDRIVCDDPHNVIDAESEVIRQGTLDWWDMTMSSRLNNPATGAKVIVMQRVHADDLSGHVLEKGGYTHLRLPAEYESDQRCATSIGWSDPRIEEGELLWPTRFNAESIVDFKRSLGSIGYSGQFQQRPVPAGGGQFKKQWFRYFTQEEKYVEMEEPSGVKRVLLEQCQKIVTVDLAISQKQTADYTVISTWAITPERELLLLDRLRDRLDNPQQQQQIQLVYQRYHPGYIMVENVAYQLALIQQLLRLGLPAREYRPPKDKVARATTAAVLYEAGRIYHPKYANWLQEWEDELLFFPLAPHDDQVDTVSMAADTLAGAQQSAEDHLIALKRRAQLSQSTQPTTTGMLSPQRPW